MKTDNGKEKRKENVNVKLFYFSSRLTIVSGQKNNKSAP